VPGRFSALPLPFGPPGTSRTLAVRRYGRPGARPKAYIQAGLHADEIPGMLVAHALALLLEQASVPGEVVVVPVANPIGLDQRLHGTALGRHTLDRGANFNRGFANLDDAVAARVADRLGTDAAANVALIRAAQAAALAEAPPRDALEGWRHALLSLALDADIVLDLHCDQESVLHLYTGQSLWPAAADLAGWLGCRLVLLADESGGNPFDEACSAPWWRLAARLGGVQTPVPAACLAATLELRGRSDVEPALAAADARSLFAFLQNRGVVAGSPGPVPGAPCQVSPLTGVDRVTAPGAGIVCHHVGLGETVAAGQVVAEIVDPSTADPATGRTPLVSRTTGLVWARASARFAQAGDVVVSIAGPEALPSRAGNLLTD
jgi:predicted deacylase